MLALDSRSLTPIPQVVLPDAKGLLYTTESATGEADGDPCKVGVAITDVLTGVHASNAILAALLWRERSGKGQHIDCSLLDVQVAGLANIASNYLVAQVEARRWGTAHESIVPYQVFATKDRPIAIAVANQKLWVSFCKTVGRREWIGDPRFASNPDPQILERDMIAEVPHPTIGTLRLAGVPVKYSNTPGAVRLAPPLLGEHTDEILASVLGYSDDRIAALRRDGVV